MRFQRGDPRAFRSGFFNIGLGLVLAGGGCALVPAWAQGRKPAVTIREAEMTGTPYLSLNDVADAVQGRVGIPDEAKRVAFTFRSHAVQFQLDSDQAVIDSQRAAVGGPVTQDTRGLWVPRSFFTSGPLNKEFRKWIDLGPAYTPVKPVAVVPETSMPPEPEPKAVEPVVAQPAVAPAPQAPLHAIRRIVVDPGHGGKDPGALGTRNTLEKMVNLWMANELADELRAKDFEVLLTRTDDTFIALDERTALANKHKADLFISLHCNASVAATLNGFEVYFLSEKASSPHAEAVARQENASLELEGKKPSSAVQSVLASLVMNANINRSAQLGAIINREVAARLSQADLGVKQAAFYVLRGARMPAVLVELGFLTNKKEERLLSSDSYRRKLAQAIAKSIIDFDQKQQLERKRQG